MKLREISSETEWALLEHHYIEAFPATERKPFGMIREKYEQKMTDVWIMEDEGEFSGFAITMNGEDLVLLDYYAICKEKRGLGKGSAGLKALQELYRGKRFFLEVESLSVPADNMEERRRRKQFYLQNGMMELGVNSKLFGVEFELLGFQCNVSFAEYFSLYETIYRAYACRFLEEL